MSDALTLDQIAARFSELPGAKLVGWQEVALPIFLLKLRVVLIDRQPISPIDEFLLRSMASGIDNNLDLSEYLGLDIKTVEGHLAELHRSELVSVPGSSNGEKIPVALTPRGQSAAIELSTRVAEEQVVKVYFHGISRAPIPFRTHDFLSDRDCDELGISMIAPVPAKRPSLEEISIEAVSVVLRPYWKKQGRDAELVAIKDVDREGGLRFESALMLEYKATGNDSQPQYSFVVNGERRTDYDEQFARRGGAKRIGNRIAFNKDLSEREFVKSFFEVSLPVTEEQISQAIELDETRRSIEKEIQVTVDEGVESSPHPDTRQRQAARIAELEAELSETQSRQQSLSVSVLRTNDCDKILYKAVSEAKTRVIIVSGTVSSIAIDSLIPELEKAVNDRDIDVWIGYGMNKNTTQGQKHRSSAGFDVAVGRLEQFQRRFKNKVKLADLGNSHSKILVSDDDFVVVGSYNWLSHKPLGMRSMKEHALKVSDPESIATIIKECENHFGLGSRNL